MRERIVRFMQGRYGNDQFNQFLMFVVLICIILSYFVKYIFYPLGLIVMIYLYFRIFSKNINKRYAENMQYLRATEIFRKFFNQQKSILRQRKTHHIYRCPSCKQKIRIPKGKGKIAVRCPKCGMEFIKHS